MKQRKHLRWRKWDYASAAGYFITINVNFRRPIFGKITGDMMYPSLQGKIAGACMQKIAELGWNAYVDSYQIMPDHIHCIIFLRDDPDRRPAMNAYGKPVKGSVSVIIQQYKAAVTRECNWLGITPVPWQRRFYDRVIRTEDQYLRTRKYIEDNVINYKPRKGLTVSSPNDNPKGEQI